MCKNFIDHWKHITSEQNILQAIRGYKIDFIINPIQFRVPRPIRCSPEEASNIPSQISLFLDKGIITESSHDQEQFLSTLFLREKRNGSFRMILNCKELNTWIHYHHFKMDSIHTFIPYEATLLHGIYRFKGCLLFHSSAS